MGRAVSRRARSVGVILLIGWGVTAAFVALMGDERARTRAARVEADVDRLEQRIVEDLDRAGATVEQLASMIDADAKLSPEAFGRFTANTLLREPALSALGWVARVSRDARESFVAESRRTLDPEFFIWEIPDPGGLLPPTDAFVVQLIEPLERNARAVGLDIASEARRRKTLETCIETMSLTATPPLSLVQNPEEKFDFLALYPLFDPTARVGSSGERRQACLGVVGGVFRSSELFDRSFRRVSTDFDIRVIDRTAEAAETVHVSLADRNDPLDTTAEPIAERSLAWAGRQWQLEFFPRPAYLASIASGSVHWIWLVGGFLTILLAFAFHIAATRAHLSVEQEVLRRDEERFRLTLGVVSDGWWDWDLTSGHLILSPTWLRTFGREAVPPEEGLAKLEEWVHPEDVAARRRAVVEHRRGATNEFSLELRIAHADGRYRWVIERGSVVTTDRGGVPVRMVAAIQEITLQKLMEKERTEMEEKLRETQRLESLGLIAGGVAHDFNNWLTTIRNNVLVARESGESTPGVDEALAEIESATLKAGGLTSQLLDYSGKGAMSSQGIDLGTLALEMRDLLRTVVGRGITIEIRAPEEPATLVGDPTQIAQVLMNLIVNAADAMEGNGTVGVTISVLDVPRPLPTESDSGSHLPPGRYSTLIVEDTGPGMTKEVRARIFEPFYTTKATGRGLGLAGVQGILRRHRGMITVDTAPGKGARFWVYLPHAGALAPSEVRVGRRSAAQQAKTPAPPRRVLIVDDEDGVRESLARLLRRRGHEVETADSGQAGIGTLAADSRPWDLVIIDMTMPGLDGLETFRELRKLQPDLRGLLISGYAVEEVGELPPGFIGYFQKPFRTEELIDAVGQLKTKVERD